MAIAAGVPGADLIPDDVRALPRLHVDAEGGLGPGLIANHETLGYVDLRGGYFHGGTHMHLSHLTEDLEAWYLNFDFDERVAHRVPAGPRRTCKQGAQTVPQGPTDVATAAELTRRVQADRALRAQRVDPGDLASAGGRRRPGRDGRTRRARRSRSGPTSTRSTTRSCSRPIRRATSWSATPVAGVHFVVFNPSSDDFERNRLAMDGVLPDGTKLEVEPRARAPRASTRC